MALERNAALDEDIAVLQYEVARLHEALERSQQRVLDLAAMDGANDPLPTRRYIPPGGVS